MTKKFRGALETKKIGIIALIVFVLASAAYAGTKFFGNDKVKIAKALQGVSTEYSQTVNDFAPDLDWPKILDSIANEGVYAFSMDVKTESMPTSAVGGLGNIQVNYSLTQNIPARQSEVNVEANMYSFFRTNLNVKVLDNTLYLDIPLLYNKALQANVKTLGSDIMKSPAKEDVLALASDNPEIKENIPNLSIDPFAKPATFNEMKTSYASFIKDEMKTLVGNAKVEKLDSVSLQSDQGDMKVTPYNVLLKGDDVKKLGLKSFDFYKEVQKEKLPEFLIEDMLKEIDETKKDLENEDIPDIALLVYLDSKDKLRRLDIDQATEDKKEEVAPVSMEFLGDKNTTDHVVFSLPQNPESKVEMKLERGSTNKVTYFSEAFKGEKTYNTKNHSLTSSFTLPSENISLEAKGKIKDIKKGQSFVVELDKFAITMPESPAITLTGTVALDTKVKSLKAPKNSVEVLKLKEPEYKKLKSDIQNTLMQTFGLLTGM